MGILAALLSHKPLSGDHILTRVAAGEIHLKVPLRCHGLLRNEPARLPWGYSLDIALANIETAED